MLKKNYALVHSLQDVLTPIAAAFVLADLCPIVAVDRFPIVNDLLELCWAKCPQAVRQQGLTPTELWISDGKSVSEPNRLNSHAEIQMVRAARQCFYEARPYTRAEAQEEAEVQCVDGLPRGEDVYVRENRVRIFHWCQICGSKLHKTEGCEIPLKPCNYDHLGFEYAPHTIVTCPALHSWCKNCWIRGHETNLHGPRNVCTAGQLRRYFNNAAPCGILTSAIFLRPKDRERKSFIRAGLYGSNRVMASAEARLAGHIYPFDEQEKAASRKLRDEAIAALEVAYKSANVGAGSALAGKKSKGKGKKK